jgi:hypothetical protein
VHLNGLSVAWIRLCFRTSAFVLNFTRQTSHSKVGSPEKKSIVGKIYDLSMLNISHHECFYALSDHMLDEMILNTHCNCIAFPEID